MAWRHHPLRWLSLALVVSIGPVAAALEFVALDWTMTDRYEQLRIEISYTNATERRLCLPQGDWPNSAGKLNQMGDVVALIVSDERFPIRDFNTGYCLGGCTLKIDRGTSIHGFIPYEEFDLPERLRYASKRLIFPVKAYVCD